MTRVALVGNPNCGKTTVFNQLTGTHQRVGNWPGVTVEKKSGRFDIAADHYELIDLPGTYSLDDATSGIDEQIARDYLNSGSADVIVNVIDAAALSRGLYLTNQLCGIDKPMVVVLNMIDVAEGRGHSIDAAVLADKLGCPVIAMVASRGQGVAGLLDAIGRAQATTQHPHAISASAEVAEVYAAIDALLESATETREPPRTASERIDRIVLNRLLAFPIFLGVMYLMFCSAINVGSAFIDFFDGSAAALFVEVPRACSRPSARRRGCTHLLADGVGGGVQLVGTFIPVIGCLFLVLSLLEDSATWRGSRSSSTACCERSACRASRSCRSSSASAATCPR